MSATLYRAVGDDSLASLSPHGQPAIVVMRSNASQPEINHVLDSITEMGCVAHLSKGNEGTLIGAVGNDQPLEHKRLEPLSGVERVMRLPGACQLASRAFHPQDRVVELPNGVRIGGGCDPVIMAGPCAVESMEVLSDVAKSVHSAGVRVLRGGAFKPRTSPYSFQGLGEQGLMMLRETADRHGMAVITEVLDPNDVPLVAEYAEVLQIGARNMQNYPLLRAVGECDRPVLLKRGLAATIDELLQAAEYILAHGNHEVILCERGIRTFETATRFTLDINAVPVLRQRTSLPIIVDPSHATGQADLVRPVALAAIAAGADGLLIEVHPNPIEALSDGPQSLEPEAFAELATAVTRVADAVGRVVA